MTALLPKALRARSRKNCQFSGCINLMLSREPAGLLIERKLT